MSKLGKLMLYVKEGTILEGVAFYDDKQQAVAGKQLDKFKPRDMDTLVVQFKVIPKDYEVSKPR